ncbi:alpha/beta fold hydrolase [Goodfellowiella coeruleoviolacea]|uniref:Pimeloyl-ACP methyl ester carboxylesterase n=1 Tax=Goodfellowiella coeruleoviolacea TaxID=334858 RepID=A0AAE3GEK5_9PSEU|nr:alpha/beta hydrolase [Goodfellowiella coeruleoviolacea]MCP2164698.1 Pimeloyl-ACP methyl ester carboxylesterase [Goodfellowiella coeruleoviolacea]
MVDHSRAGVVDFGGDGPAILLLHGLMGRATTWWSVARWLRRHGRVVGLDARGHGDHPCPGGPWRTEDFVADIVARLDDLALGPVVVIGHSMGGLHGMALAAAHPDLVRAVVVEDMAVDQRGRSVDEWRDWFAAWPPAFESVAHVREFFGPQGDYFVECVRERADGYHLLAALDDMYEIAGEWGRRDYWSVVERVRCPLLVLEAEHTGMPAGQQAEMARRAPHGRHLVVPGAGHVVHHDAPAFYRGAVEAFLSQVLAAPVG